MRRPRLRAVGQGGRAPHPDRTLHDGRRLGRGAGVAAPVQAQGVAGVRRRARRLAADGDAAAPAAPPSPDPGHGAGHARLLPDPAILARRQPGEPRQHGAAAGRPLRRGAAPHPARDGRGQAPDRLPRRRRLPPAPQGQGRRRRRRPAGRGRRSPRRHRRPAGAALLPARRQRRALRRRDRGDGGAGAAGDPGLLERPRRAPGHRQVLQARRPPDDRRHGVADRFLAGRWPGLQRRGGGGGGAGRPRPALRRRAPGRVPDAGGMGRVGSRPDAGRDHDHGGDPRDRRRHRPHPVRRPLGRRGGHLPRLRARLLLSHRRAAPRHAFLRRARRHAGRARRPSSWRCAARPARRARSASCSSTSRRTPATPARPPTCPCSSRSTAPCSR